VKEGAKGEESVGFRKGEWEISMIPSLDIKKEKEGHPAAGNGEAK